MSLRTKRNIPLVFVLLALLAALTLTMGNQSITSYTFHTGGQSSDTAVLVSAGLASSD